MSLQSISFALISFWLGGMALCSSEVVLVNRDEIDSFRVGRDGCKSNTMSPNDVCPTSANCRMPEGICECDSSRPTYRKFILNTNGLKGLVYGCVNDSLIGLSSHNETCSFTLTSDVIPFSRDGNASIFSYDNSSVQLQSCSLVKAWEKAPNTTTKKPLKSLNESVVDLNVSGSRLYFKWKKSMSELQGKIIYFNLTCKRKNDSNSSPFNSCLGAKIRGNWSAKASNKPTEGGTKSAGPDKEGFFHTNTFTKIVIGVLALSLLVIIVLAIVLKCVCKKQQSHKDTCLEEAEMSNIDEQRQENPESNLDGYAVVRRGKKNEGAFFNNNERASDAYEDMPTGTEKNLVSLQSPQRKNSVRQSGDYEDMHPGTANMCYFEEPLYKNNERLSDVYEEQDPTKKYTTLRRGSQEELEEEENYQHLAPLENEKELQV